MRILAVADLFPWPPSSGGTLRVSRNIEALSHLGEVDLFSLYDVRAAPPEVPDHVRIARLGLAPYPAPRPAREALADGVVRHRLPWSIALRAGDRRPAEAFRAFCRPRYDVVWFSRVGPWTWLGRPRVGPTIIDIDDFEDVKARQHAALLAATPAHGATSRARRATSVARARQDAEAWRRLQQAAVGAAARVVVCSEADAARLATPKAAVVPNTMARPAVPVGREAPGHPPTVLFPASFDYGPNVEGARWLVEEVAPHLEAHIPGARIRLAGRPGPEVEALADPPRVTVTGRVARMEDELAGADVVVVPLRRGSGTRLKIIEAMAQRVPVVTTSLGAEGLEVADGVHLLVADDAEGMARAVARLCDEPELRSALVEAAHVRVLQRYEDHVAAERIRDLVDGVAAPSAPAR